MRGIFISFEGSDGCGKSTQIALLARRLEEAGVRVRTTREPGGTPIGEQIRHLLQTAKEGDAMEPETELLLFAASRAQLVREVIEPALAEGVAVLADRFFDSTTVYQGVARKLDAARVREINEFALGDLRPDLTLVFDLDPTAARERIEARSEPGTQRDRMESQPPAFYEAVRDGYLAVARTEPERVKVIDAEGSVEEVQARVNHILKEKFHGLFA
jgi:dTMP kinase